MTEYTIYEADGATSAVEADNEDANPSGVLQDWTPHDTNDAHFFASHCLGWATAATREEAVEKVVRAFERDIKPAIKNCHKSGEPGWYVWSCEVPLPEDAHYEIEWYAPVDVGAHSGVSQSVTYLTKDKLALYTHPPKHKRKEKDNGRTAATNFVSSLI
jgi:hypothetical protein